MEQPETHNPAAGPHLGAHPDNVIRTQHSRKRQFQMYNIFMVVAMGFGSMSYGYSASIIATTLAQPSFLKYFELDTRPDATSLISTMNGLYQVGGFLATLTVTYFADKWGRKTGIAVSALICLISGAFLAGSTNIGEFIFFRFISGAGAFMILAAVPIWMTEVVPPATRGIFVDIHGACLLFGYAFANWVGFGFYFLTDNPNAWRAALAFQCLPPAALLLGIYWLPESPRWLLMHDRYEEARDNLLILHTSEEANIEIAQIQGQMQIDKTLNSSYLNMFKKPSYRKRSFLAIGTTCAIQCSGALVINNYGPTIYAGLGYGTQKQLLLEAGWSTLGFGAGCLAFFLVDRFPRPKLISAGIAGCMVMLILEAALVANFAGTSNTAGLQAAVAMIFIYIVFYEVALDGTQFVYLGELFPSHLRAKGVSLGVAGICIMNVLWLQVAPTAFANIGWKFYLCFIIPGSLAAIGIWLYFPDTWGIPLEEVARLFGDEDDLFQGDLNITNKESNIQGDLESSKEDI